MQYCSLQGKGYARIRQDYEDFYTRRMYYRIHVCPRRLRRTQPRICVEAYVKCILMDGMFKPCARSHLATADALSSNAFQDCFNRPIASAPDRVIDVLVRTPVSGQKCVPIV